RIRKAFVIRVVTIFLVGALLAGLGVAAPRLLSWWRAANSAAAPPASAEEDSGRARLEGENVLALPADVVQAPGVAPAGCRAATTPCPLPPLAGSLALDANSLVRVHARFAGEVVEIGLVNSHDADPRSVGPTEFRPVRSGDRVRKGQLLAVVWSKD